MLPSHITTKNQKPPKTKNNKRAISLIEVLMSIMLLTLVIGAIFKIKDNNLLFLEYFSKNQQFNTYVALAISSYTKELKNENIYLDEVADFKDDEIRQKLKLIKVIRKDTDEKKTLPILDVPYTIKSSEYKVGDSHTSILYSVSFD